MRDASLPVLLIFLASLPWLAKAQDPALYEKKWLVESADSLPYRLLLPDGFHKDSAYPLVLFLHGSGERGNDNEKQLQKGGQLFLKTDIRRKYPAIVVFPQCPQPFTWANEKESIDSLGKKKHEFPLDNAPSPAMQMTIKLVQQLMADYRIKHQQVYVMGLSMGGMGTFDIVRRMPKTFAAAIAIGGGANPEIAKDIRHTAFWIIQGSSDEEVSPALSETMVQAIQSFYDAAEMQYTVYPKTGHNTWDMAFADPELLPWLFSQRKP
jgi:predicted peptidase